MIAESTPRQASANGNVAAQIDLPLNTSVTAWSSPAGAAQAGGDWCAAVVISEDTIALTIGDVAGHGDAAAAMMSKMQTTVLQAVRRTIVPSEILAVANRVALESSDGVVVTAVVAFVDWRRRTLSFANAGHPPPLLLAVDGLAFLEHSPADVPLGVSSKHRAADYVIALPSDAMLIFYTDGITEHAYDPVRGEKELMNAARLAFDRPRANAARAIALHVLRKQRGRDDAAVLALRTVDQAS